MQVFQGGSVVVLLFVGSRNSALCVRMCCFQRLFLWSYSRFLHNLGQGAVVDCCWGWTLLPLCPLPCTIGIPLGHSGPY